MTLTPKEGRPLVVVIATRNAHKVEEIRAILGGEFFCRALNNLPGAPAVVEDASTFTGNATKKAVHLADWLAAHPSPEAASAGAGVFVLADDSGLEVDALGGAPGVHSARFAGLDASQGASAGNSPDADNNAKLLRLLREVPPEKRTARFRCVLALTPVPVPRIERQSPTCYVSASELETEIFEGACEGRIGFAAQGRGGFGYDPLFIPTGYQQSFAELGEAVKNRLSHRAQALLKLKARLPGRIA